MNQPKDRWIDGQTDGLVGEWVGGLVDCRLRGWTDVSMVGSYIDK